MINKVMLIDDDYATNLYHEIIITESKLVDQLIICQSVDEAISQLESMAEKPDLIFLDMNMPMKNAWDFLLEYAEKVAIKESEIIILSTTKNPDDVEQAEQNPLVDAFITKPLQIPFLESYIAENRVEM